MRQFFQASASEEEIHEYREELRGTRPFFLIFSFVLIAMYGWTFYSQPELRAPNTLIPIVLLGIIHGVLHLLSPHLVITRRWIVPYFFVQGVLSLPSTSSYRTKG